MYAQQMDQRFSAGNPPSHQRVGGSSVNGPPLQHQVSAGINGDRSALASFQNNQLKQQFSSGYSSSNVTSNFHNTNQQMQQAQTVTHQQSSSQLDTTNRYDVQREETFEERLERIKRKNGMPPRPPSGDVRKKNGPLTSSR